VGLGAMAQCRHSTLIRNNEGLFYSAALPEGRAPLTMAGWGSRLAPNTRLTIRIESDWGL
jgi:hypothetical protein